MNVAISAKQLIDAARSEGRSALDEATAKTLLAEFGIKTPARVTVPDAAAVAAALDGRAGPFVVKVISPEILHKSDAGGVALNLLDAAEVEGAINRMAALPGIVGKQLDGWLVEEMAPRGREVVIGGLRDPQFGPMVMVGLGGIFVEVLKDVAFRLCPIDRSTAYDMLDALQSKALLHGARGEAGVDLDALVDAILAVGGEDGLLMRLVDEVAEIDLNPIIVSEKGVVAVDARIILADTSQAPVELQTAAALDSFAPLFQPRSVAVLGASTKEVAIANTFIRRMKAFGYKGQIWPIHPTADEIEGLPAYPSIEQAPEHVDYAYIAIGAKRIPDVIAAAKGRLSVAQVISSGFAEVEDGVDLQRDLVAKAKVAGVRVLGPNCLGTYSPRGGLTFPSDAPTELGNVGIVSQSGGLSTDIVKRGQWRGLRFSGLVTMGNSADVQPHELVSYYFDDPQTRVVGMYIEDIRAGRAFFDLLRTHPAPKPVVILKGGRSELGRMAAASHTGALAGDDMAWDALSAQLPVALTQSVDEFIDALLMLQSLTLRPQKPTRNVALFGNGGGSSVLGADAFAARGLAVAPFSGAARVALEGLGLPPGTSVINPIDTPVRTLQEKDGFVAAEILEHVCNLARPDAVAMHLNLAAFVGRGSVDPIGNLFKVIEQTIAKYPDVAHFALALRSDGSPELDATRREYRERARAIGLPTFDEIPAMAQALSVVGHIETRLAARGI